MNFIFKHLGILLIIYISFMHSVLSFKLGIRRQNKQFIFTDHTTLKNNEDYENNNEIIKSANTNFNVKSMNKYKRDSKNYKKNREKCTSVIEQAQVDFTRNIASIHTFLIETLIIISIIILGVIFLPFIYNMKGNTGKLEQNITDTWFYSCSLENTDSILNIIELIMFIFIFMIGKTAKNFDFIFTFMEYFAYSVGLSIPFGPIIDIVTYSIFSQQKVAKVYIDFLLNTICYLFIYITYAWNIMFTIHKKQGNDSTCYFIFKRHEFCSVHDSNYCGCKINMTKDELKTNNDNYILFYKLCSEIISK